MAVRGQMRSVNIWEETVTQSAPVEAMKELLKACLHACYVKCELLTS